MTNAEAIAQIIGPYIDQGKPLGAERITALARMLVSMGQLGVDPDADAWLEPAAPQILP